MTTSHAKRQLTLIDQSVADYQMLIEGLPEDMPYVLIESGQDGIAQLGAALAGWEDLSALHVISHGAPGKLLLGNTWLDAGTLQEQASSLQFIGNSLAPEGDLLLYGCAVAEGESGMAFIRQLAEITRADVAASTNLSGQGGDWLLEAATGDIEVLPLAVPDSTTALDASTTVPDDPWYSYAEVLSSLQTYAKDGITEQEQYLAAWNYYYARDNNLFATDYLEWITNATLASGFPANESWWGGLRKYQR